MAEDAAQSASAPADADDQRLARALIGYRRREVRQLLAEVEATIQAVDADKVELAERIDRLEAELALHRELASLLNSTLVSADRTADTIRQRARVETDQLLDETHAEARRVTAEARAEQEDVGREAHRVLSSLQTALSILESAPAEAEPEPPPDTLVETLHDQIRRLGP